MLDSRKLATLVTSMAWWNFSLYSYISKSNKIRRKGRCWIILEVPQGGLRPDDKVNIVTDSLRAWVGRGLSELPNTIINGGVDFFLKIEVSISRVSCEIACPRIRLRDYRK